MTSKVITVLITMFVPPARAQNLEKPTAREFRIKNLLYYLVYPVAVKLLQSHVSGNTFLIRSTD